MADFPVAAIIGISVGGALVLLLIGLLLAWAATKGRRVRNTTNLQEAGVLRRKQSARRAVLDVSGRFDSSDSYEVRDVYPQSRTYQQDGPRTSFKFDASALTTGEQRMSYDRPYSNNLPRQAPQTRKAVGGYGEVSMISKGGPRTSDLSMGSTGHDRINSQTYLLPKPEPKAIVVMNRLCRWDRAPLAQSVTGNKGDESSKSDSDNSRAHPADRPPAPLPPGQRGFIHVQRPVHHDPRQSYMMQPVVHAPRIDSFRASNGVDLGAQYDQAAWMMSSLERERFSRRY